MQDPQESVPRLDPAVAGALHRRLQVRVFLGLFATSVLIGSIFTYLLYDSQSDQIEQELVADILQLGAAGGITLDVG